MQDPYGWFQWFCRFYQGRRTEDDERQIGQFNIINFFFSKKISLLYFAGRWSRCAGEKGRWKNNLISKVEEISIIGLKLDLQIAKAGCGYDNFGVSPVVRQLYIKLESSAPLRGASF